MSIFKNNNKNSKTEERGMQEQFDLEQKHSDVQNALKGFREISMEDLEMVYGGVVTYQAGPSNKLFWALVDKLVEQGLSEDDARRYAEKMFGLPSSFAERE